MRPGHSIPVWWCCAASVGAHGAVLAVIALLPRPVVVVAPGESETAPMFLVVETEPEPVSPAETVMAPEVSYEAPPSVLAQIGLLEPREQPSQPQRVTAPAPTPPAVQASHSHAFADAMHAAGRSLDRAGEAIGGFRERVIVGLSKLPPVTASGSRAPSTNVGDGTAEKRGGGGGPAVPTTSGNAGMALRGPVPAADNPAPIYPKDEARQGHQGTVLLHVVVGKDGHVVSTEVARSSGFSALDTTAVEAVRAWRFDPALDHDGHPQQCEADLPIHFALKASRGGR